MEKNKSIAETEPKQPTTEEKTAEKKPVRSLKVLFFIGALIFIPLFIAAGFYFYTFFTLLPDAPQKAPEKVLAYQPTTMIEKPQIVAEQEPLSQPKITEVKYVIPESLSNSINKLNDKVGKIEVLSEQYMNIKADSSTVLNMVERLDNIEKKTLRLSQISNDGALILTAVLLIKETAANGQSFRYEAEILKQLASSQPDIAANIDYIYNNSSRNYASNQTLIAQYNRISQTVITGLNHEGDWKTRLVRKIKQYVHISEPKTDKENLDEIAILNQIKTLVDEGQLLQAINELGKSENQKLLTNEELNEWYKHVNSKLKFNQAISEISLYSLSLMKAEGFKHAEP